MAGGITPHQTGTQTAEDRALSDAVTHRAAYPSSRPHALRVTVQAEGRYALPERRYVYGASPLRMRPTL